ncbi:hypothetical protein E2C01_005158 [Portunus trituberculatus]|uniref:Uncharacterized protein n=1 Tax=Portunus trituberculatus TaxID=210409 RepID=A0A5B7CSK2_PORTR|nr:hypothetical protein [Portunus trituberculatus]
MTLHPQGGGNNTLTDTSKMSTSKYNSRMLQHYHTNFFFSDQTTAETLITTTTEPTDNIRLQKNSFLSLKDETLSMCSSYHNESNTSEHNDLTTPLMHTSRLSLHVKIFVAFQL